MKNALLIFLLLMAPSVASCQSYKNLFERSGKIGIGTNQPDELLTVKGKIHTREVIVDLKGAVAPDYVFEHHYNGLSSLHPSYRMLSLKEIEAYTKANHHLPGIPSSRQMEQEGVALKEMNLKLLEKIEELTLHTIAQQKQIDALNERLKALEN